MNKRIIYDGILKVSEATKGITAYTWSNVEGFEPPTPDTPMSEDAHMFVLNGVEFKPNYFLNGDTKFKCAYKVDNVDTIMIELIKETGLTNIKLRFDKGLPLNETEETFMFYEILPDNSIKTFIINTSGKSCTVLYKDGTFSLESEE